MNDKEFDEFFKKELELWALEREKEINQWLKKHPEREAEIDKNPDNFKKRLNQLVIEKYGHLL